MLRLKYLTDDELSRLFSWIKQHEKEPTWELPCFVIRFILGTGARVSELTTLQTADCFPDGIVILHKTKNNKPRQVRVSPELWPFYLQHYEKVVASRRHYFFHNPNRKSGQYSISWFQKTWKNVLRAAGIRVLNIHAGRHTWATWEIASRRLEFNEVQAQLGHSNPTITMQFYAHAVTEMLYQKDRQPKFWRMAQYQ